MKKYLEQFYSAFGDRGVMFLLYASSVVLHALLSVGMELPAIHPDEIGVASIAAFYSGRDWSGVMGEIGYYYGYIQALLYTPLFFLFGSNSYALYKSMLVMNGVLISLIPAIAYHLATKLGVDKVWQKTLIAVSCGLYTTYLAHSKFIWNEAICSLLPWALVWVIFMAWDRKNRYSKFSMSVLAGFLCAVCYAAHQRLIAVVIAAVLTIILARVIFKEKLVNISAFTLTAVFSFITEHFFSETIKSAVWGEVTNNTIEGEFDRVESFMAEGGFTDFIGVLSGHLYTFFTSTFGLGALALVVLFCLIAAASSDYAEVRRRSVEDGTQEYSAPKRTYSLRLTIFALYALFAVGGTLVMSAVFKFGSPKVDSVKDLVLFGRYTDSTAPLAIMVVLAFLFMYGLKLRHVLSASAVYGAVCALFAFTGYPMVEAAETYRESPVLGLLAWRIGEDMSEPLTGMSFVIMSACVFSAFGMMIVFLSCSKRHCKQAISALVCGAFIYTSVFVCYEYIPMRAEENISKTAPAEEISEYLYNDPQSPVIAAYLVPSRTASLVQFLNPDTKVLIIKEKKDIPESCILITERSRSVPFEIGSYDVVGRTEGYTIYAYGEGARDFVRYKANS